MQHTLIRRQKIGHSLSIAKVGANDFLLLALLSEFESVIALTPLDCITFESTGICFTMTLPSQECRLSNPLNIYDLRICFPVKWRRWSFSLRRMKKALNGLPNFGRFTGRLENACGSKHYELVSVGFSSNQNFLSNFTLNLLSFVWWPNINQSRIFLQIYFPLRFDYHRQNKTPNHKYIFLSAF